MEQPSKFVLAALGAATELHLIILEAVLQRTGKVVR
jgi:hypothetical protein